MSDQPVVSVIIPAYRAEATLPGAVRSLLAQTHPWWQAIVASDDGVDYLAVLERAGICDERLQQVSTGACGSGEGNVRNVALASARGAILCDLDADDEFRATRLEQLAPLALAYGAAVDNTGVHRPGGGLYKRPFPDTRAITRLTADAILTVRIPFFAVFRRELAGDGWTMVPFAADVLFNLKLLCAAPLMVVHPASLYVYLKRDGSITQAPDTAEAAERGYAAILDLLESRALRPGKDVRAAAHAEFTANRRVNRLFRHYLPRGRCASLEDFLDLTQNGRAPWVEAERAHLSEEPARAA
jgi:succinoglycan biosynthesis protein ExoO